MTWGLAAAATFAKATMCYGSEAIAGAASMAYLHNIQKGCAEKGAQLGGAFGRSIGLFAGKAIAGASVQTAKDGQKAIAEVAYRTGAMAINSFQTTPSKSQENSNWTQTGWDVAKGITVAAGSLCIGPAVASIASLAVAGAVIAAAPKIISSLTEEIKSTTDKAPNLIDDIAIPVAKALLIQAATLTVGNIIRIEVINAAYKARVKEGTAIGKTFGTYLPKQFSTYCETAGKWMGHMDAGRYAMSDQVIDIANGSAQLGQNIVYAGLQVADHIVPAKPSNAPSTSWDTARRVGWLAAGIIGGAALAVVAPEIAAVTATVAGLEVAHNAIRWIRTPSPSKEKPAAFDIQALADLMKPKAALNLQTLSMAASAA